MKGKLLFAAALVAAGVVGTQAVRLANSSWSLQLLENQQLGGVNPLAADEETSDEADATVDKERPADDNTDVTSWIVNPDFGGNNVDGWSFTQGSVGFQNTGTAEAVRNPWTKAFPLDMSQELTGLPVGKYKLSVQGWCNIANQVYLYANNGTDASTAFETGITGSLAEVSNAFNGDLSAHRLAVENLIVSDGQLKIGVRCSYGGDGWFVFDNFQLTYVDDGLTELKQMYTEKNSEIEAYQASFIFTELNDAYASLGQVPEENSDAYADAYVRLNEFLQACQSQDMVQLKEAVDDYTDIATQVEGLDDINTAIEMAKEALKSVQNVAGVQNIMGQLQEECNAALENVGKVDVVLSETKFDDSKAEGWNGVGKFGNGVMEFYNSNFDFNREFTNLPDGWYQLTLNGFYRNDVADGGASYRANSYVNNWRIYGNDYELPLMCVYEETNTSGKIDGEYVDDGVYPGGMGSANANFEAGRYLNTLNVWVSDGTLKVGVKGNGTGGARWCCLDNVKLTYKGNDFQGAWLAMKENAIALAGRYGMAAYVDVLEALAQPETVDESAVLELNEKAEAIVQMSNSLAEYSIWKKSSSEYQNQQVFRSSTVADEALETAWDEAVGYSENLKLENITKAEDLVGKLSDAFNAYAAGVTDLAEGVEQLDVTFMAENMDFSSGDVAPWTKTVENDNFRMMAPNTNDLKYNGRFLESYVNTSKVANNANKKLVYQTVTGMPKGSYKFQARAFNRDAWFQDGRTPNPIIIYVNGGEAEANSTTLENVFTVEGNSADGMVEFGLKSPENFNTDWNGIADAHLYYMGTPDVALNEASAYSVTSDTYADVTMARKLGAGKWNTFCVPFDMTAEQLAANGISKVVELSVNPASTNESINLTSEEVTEVKAGVPYLVQVEEAVSEISVDGVYVTAAAPAAQALGQAGDYTVAMTGNYSATTVPTDAYFISGNTFYVADAEATVTLKGFRAYITLTDDSGEPAQANVRTISIDGNTAGDGTTGIEGVSGGTADQLVDVYTLSGVKVKGGVKASEALDGLQRGVYIVNGKKIIK